MVKLCSLAMYVLLSVVVLSGSIEAQQSFIDTDRKTSSVYRIWEEDVLEIRIYGDSELSIKVRVDETGVIRLAEFQMAIQVACLSPKEAAERIEFELLKIQDITKVSVSVTEYSRPPIVITGAVRAAQRAQLRRSRIRLTELITLAGGLSEDATGVVLVTRTIRPRACDMPDSSLVDDRALSFPNSVAYHISKIAKGDAESNPWLFPGDEVTLPRMQRAFVWGSVVRPSGIYLLPGETLSTAITKAGGLTPDAANKAIVVCRQINNGNDVKAITIDLQAITAKRARDFPLEDCDVIHVPQRAPVSARGPAYCYPRGRFNSPSPPLTQRTVY